jgi:hypothetical protein
MTGRVTDPSGPAHYEIRVAGVLDGRWTAWFNGLQISGQGEETVISGLVPDQSALHGLLTKVRDLGLCLISVRRVDPVEAGNEAPLSRTDLGTHCRVTRGRRFAGRAYDYRLQKAIWS